MSASTLSSDSPEATHAIGRRLGAAMACGDVVALIGPLGAGKTALTKGIAEGAGVQDARQVSSPTFVIVNEYETARGLAVLHVDAYRLRGAGDLEALGFDEMCTRGAVIIEWADRVQGLLPGDLLTITIEPTGERERTLRLDASGPSTERLLASVLLPAHG